MTNLILYYLQKICFKAMINPIPASRLKTLLANIDWQGKCGIIIYVCNTLISTHFFASNCDFEEHQWAKFVFLKIITFLLAAFTIALLVTRQQNIALLCDLFHKLNDVNFFHTY